MLLFLGIALLIVWALGTLVFHFGAIVWVALVVGLGVIAWHWFARGRAVQK